ncbi:MAG: hypothetical protein KL785_01650 [Brevundimonas sp.]|jgi:hypothetical protein|nr:hypothetical protein [Brevundimonas sp.]
MWFGLPAEIAVRCGHCGENDWRTPVELKSGRLVCFMCTRVSDLPPAVAAPAAGAGTGAGEAAASTLGEIGRRLARFQPLAPAGSHEVGQRLTDALSRTCPEPSTR